MKKENVIHYFYNMAERPLSLNEINNYFNCKSKKKIKELNFIIKELIDEGVIVKTRKSRYSVPSQMNLITGYIKKNKKGYAFLISDNIDQEDIFIAPNDLNGALNNDRVIVRILKKEIIEDNFKQRAEGIVVRITERANTTFVGEIYPNKHYGFVIPDDILFPGDIFIRGKYLGSLKKGDKVLVEVLKWPDKKHSAEGRIIKAIGHKNDIGMDVLSIIYRHHLRNDFPNKVKRAAKRINTNITNEDINSRIDLRDKFFITIDGSDAKDLDDAVYIEKKSNGNFLLYVSIADVGEYVEANSDLDKEAFKRGTSVYLVDRVLPMLPEELSNGICSLCPHVDRLTLTCIMEVSNDGDVISSSIVESIINSHKRLTYEFVNKVIEGTEQIFPLDLSVMIEHFVKLQKILYNKRCNRGSIDFSLKESYVKLNDQGQVIEIGWKERGVSERIIEECMILANETIAKKYCNKIPFLYRVHEAPEQDKLVDIKRYLKMLGYDVFRGSESIQSIDLQHILDKVEDTDEAYIINMALLRSMKHAYYSKEEKGHFGLAAQYYSHFTSPIRRYSDLVVHRVIKELIHNENLTKKRWNELDKLMESYAEQTSMTERIAEEAERDSKEMKRVEYMSQYIGEIFSGIIVNITQFGFFVQLDNSAEGLVHISRLLDDFYEFFPEFYKLIGRNSNRTFTIGQKVKVRVINAKIEEMHLDFDLINN